MKRAMLLVLSLVFLFSLGGCSGENPDGFANTPSGRLFKENLDFMQNFEETGIIRITRTTEVFLYAGLDEVMSSTKVVVETLQDSNQDNMEMTVTQDGSDPNTLIWKRINGEYAVLSVTSSGVLARLTEEGSLDAEILAMGGFPTANLLPSTAKINQFGKSFRAEIRDASALYSPYLYRAIDSAFVSPLGEIIDTQVMNCRFSFDEKTYWEKWQVVYRQIFAGTEYKVRIRSSLKATILESADLIDLSDKVYFDPLDKELAVPHDFRGGQANERIPANLGSPLQEQWMAFLLDPGFYLVQPLNNPFTTEGTLLDEEGNVLDSEVASVPAQGTYYYRMTSSVLNPVEEEIWVYRIPEEQVGTPLSPLYTETSDDPLTGTVTGTSPRYLLFAEREGYTLNVTVQPTAVSGLVLFSCGGTRSALYAGETFTFEADADSPVFAQISGDGSYSLKITLEYR